MGLFKSILKNVADNIGDQLKDAIADKKNSHSGNDSITMAKTTENNPEKNVEVYGVDDLIVKFDGQKYAVVNICDKKVENKTGYDYNDVLGMSQYHIRVAQNQPDGTIRYGLISACGGFHIIPCEYIAVNFFNGEDLLLIDEDGDEYVANRFCELTLKEPYIQELIESLNEDAEEEEEEED